jgi:predicted nucleic acid-binding protein
MLELTPEVCEYAAAFSAEHGLELIDAVHVACALWHGCEWLLTSDRKLTWAAGPLLDVVVLI